VGVQWCDDEQKKAVEREPEVFSSAGCLQLACTVNLRAAHHHSLSGPDAF